MRVLIAPVGEQPIPNLIPLFAAEAQKPFTLVQFMVADDSRIRKVATNLRKTITFNTSVKVADKDLAMNAWDLAKAREECEAAITSYFQKGSEVIVNLTGGTKIMALAAYQAAVNKHAPMIYVNTADAELLHFSPDGSLAERKRFKIVIPIATQLHAAGRELVQRPSRNLNEILPNYRKLVRWIVDNYAAAIQNCILPVTKFINAERQKNKWCNHPFNLPYHAPLALQIKDSQLAAEHLKQEGFWDWNGTEVTIATEPQWWFVTSGWLEAYTVTTLQDQKERDFIDEVIGPVYVKDFPEIDAIATKNGQLAILECKLTGKVDDEGEAAAEILAKLYSHEHLLGGLYGKSVFVRARGQQQGAQEWTSEYQVELVAGSELKNLATKVISLFKV
jgi:hypothetical protein